MYEFGILFLYEEIYLKAFFLLLMQKDRVNFNYFFYTSDSHENTVGRLRASLPVDTALDVMPAVRRDGDAAVGKSIDPDETFCLKKLTVIFHQCTVTYLSHRSKAVFITL